uniref:Uncharacterized protein n=1 Tax=Caenorhabditis tropicalis TaxID=1561998 RepID=A0A1I7UV41_9PELO
MVGGGTREMSAAAPNYRGAAIKNACQRVPACTVTTIQVVQAIDLTNIRSLFENTQEKIGNAKEVNTYVYEVGRGITAVLKFGTNTLEVIIDLATTVHPFTFSNASQKRKQDNTDGELKIDPKTDRPFPNSFIGDAKKKGTVQKSSKSEGPSTSTAPESSKSPKRRESSSKRRSKTPSRR